MPGFAWFWLLPGFAGVVRRVTNYAGCKLKNDVEACGRTEKHIHGCICSFPSLLDASPCIVPLPFQVLPALAWIFRRCLEFRFYTGFKLNNDVEACGKIEKAHIWLNMLFPQPSGCVSTLWQKRKMKKVTHVPRCFCTTGVELYSRFVRARALNFDSHAFPIHVI